jgi:hypothetical protein
LCNKRAVQGHLNSEGHQQRQEQCHQYGRERPIGWPKPRRPNTKLLTKPEWKNEAEGYSELYERTLDEVRLKWGEISQQEFESKHKTTMREKAAEAMFDYGEECEIVGAKDYKSFNGMKCVIINYDQGRYDVRVIGEADGYFLRRLRPDLLKGTGELRFLPPPRR